MGEGGSLSIRVENSFRVPHKNGHGIWPSFLKSQLPNSRNHTNGLSTDIPEESSEILYSLTFSFPNFSLLERTR